MKKTDKVFWGGVITGVVGLILIILGQTALSSIGVASNMSCIFWVGLALGVSGVLASLVIDAIKVIRGK